MTRKILPLVLLVAAALPATAAERLLTSPQFGPLRAYASPPAVATDGTSYLAAWIARPYTHTPSLMLQRLDTAATALPSAVVTDPRLSFSRVDLSWSNGSYLVIWNADAELHAMRVDRDGHPLAGSDRILATDLRDPVLASNGTASIVVAHTNYITNEVDVLTLDAHDNAVRRATIGNYAGAIYDAAAHDGGFTVALADAPGLYAFRYDAAGASLGAPLRVMASGNVGNTVYRPLNVTVAGRGGDTLLVWTAQAYGQPFDLLAAVLSPAGDVGPRATLPHAGSYKGTYIVNLDVAGDDGGYSVLLSEPMSDTPLAVQLESLRLRPDGTPASAPRRVTAGTAPVEGYARLARGASSYGVVWISNSPPNPSDRVNGAVTAELADVTPLLLSRGPTEQSGPSIASNGSGYLVAWLEQSQDRGQFFALPLDHNGVPASPPLLLFDRPAPTYLRPPRVAFSGGTYAVFWIGDGIVQAMRFDGVGRPLDAQPLPISTPINLDMQFDVTPTPAGFFVVWVQNGSIYGAALTGPTPTAPQKLTEHLPPPPQSSGPTFESEPHIAFNGDKFLLTYTSTFIYPCVDIPCPSLVTWEMIRLDAAGRRETEPHPIDIQVLGLASDGHDFAAIGWDDLLRIDARTLAVTARLFVASDRTPVLLWNGARYVAVAVDDEPDGGARVTAREITPEWTIGSARATHIAPRLFSLDAATNAAGDVFVAYARGIAEAPFAGATRVAVQPVGDVAPTRGRAVRR